MSAGTNRIFPPEESNTSPVLDYSESVIAWPGEFTWIQMDDVPGTDYLVVLFSKRPLDIDAIRRRFETARGSFPQRVAAAAGSDFIPYYDAKYERDEIRFSAQSVNPKAVFGLLLGIEHR